MDTRKVIVDLNKFGPLPESKDERAPMFRVGTTSCSLNATAWRHLGESEYIEVLFNEEDGAVFLRPAEGKDISTYKISPNRQINSAALNRLGRDHKALRKNIPLQDTGAGLVGYFRNAEGGGYEQ